MHQAGTGDALRSEPVDVGGGRRAASRGPGDGPREWSFSRADLAAILLLALWVVGSRVPLISDDPALSKDGPHYLHSLALDRTYDVPMPGNLGYVLLGKGAAAISGDPVRGYAMVGIGLTVAAAAFSYLFATLVVPRPLAAASAFAMTTNAMVWWYGEVIASYPVWLAVPPALGWFGVRFAREQRQRDLIAASVVLALGMILRPDLLFFGTPLWFGCLALGRARWKQWLTGGAILAAGCGCWFFGTAAVLGGVGAYLDRVHAKHVGDLEGFSLARRGLMEGLVRNGTKYTLFLVWGVHLVLIPALAGAWRMLKGLPRRWGAWVLALLWVGPSWYFSTLVFAGNAGLIFQFLPLVYVAAALGLHGRSGQGGVWRPAAAMGILGLVGVAQFLGPPLLRETDQRRVILNVTFLKYSAAGLRARYDANLDDYGISPSLASVIRQLRDPEPVATPRRRNPDRVSSR